MRTENDFINELKVTLAALFPSTTRMSKQDLSSLGTIELCLHFLATFLPHESVTAVPSLMLGYHKVIAFEPSPAFVRSMAALRHLCGRYSSVSTWNDACREYSAYLEPMRCYDIRDGKVFRRSAASADLLNLYSKYLIEPVSWVKRPLKSADPGVGRVKVERGRALLSYKIPSVPATQQLVSEHTLRERKERIPLHVDLDEMKVVASEIDKRENAPDWPLSLPQLDLRRRLDKTLRLEELEAGFFKNGVMTLNGANHLVGMLSSGKSTLVMGILFALTKGKANARIAVLVTDTIQGATLASRLNQHGVKATVVSSLYNRERHLNSIHWQQGRSTTGWSLSSLGDVSRDFSVACPLDGLQSADIPVIRGDSDRPGAPRFKEKQCHHIYQKAAKYSDDTDDVEGSVIANPNELTDEGKGKSCPLWAVCSSQSQQRDAVDAQVIIMTTQAFVHMSPDKWTLREHITMPELLQYAVDLVIVDEVDAVQKSLDDAFAPRSPIMGDDRTVYLPSILSRISETIRERSGLQFRKATNTRWQNNFHNFFRLVGSLYSLIQNEQVTLARHYKDTPFTAGSILYELWRTKTKDLRLAESVLNSEFNQVIRVASSIPHYTDLNGPGADANDVTEKPVFEDKRFQKATEELQALARQVLVTDYYTALENAVEKALPGALEPFCNLTKQELAAASDVQAVGHIDAKAKLHFNAAAILLAVIAEMALFHYNWLIKAQPAVAEDFGIGDAEVLTQANNLLKHYRSIIPSNPAGSIFGFLYDEPALDRAHAFGGKLTVINHLGVGRYLLTHLHDLLAAEGQVGPHVLMLSGTSWAGGDNAFMPGPRPDKPIDAASPTYDVQVKVKGVLLQPDVELEAIKNSIFALEEVRDQHGEQIVISGAGEKNRRANLAFIARRFATKRGAHNTFDARWEKLKKAWGSENMENRRRSLLIVNSYADAAAVADTLVEALRANGYMDWKVFCLVRDRGDDADVNRSDGPLLAERLPRSLVEKFGEQPENSILVAPMAVVSRGHNILNSASKAAISAIYFLHRPHPRPDDLGPIIGRLNRFAMSRFDKGMKENPGDTLAVRARRMRNVATDIVRYGLGSRGGYQSLNSEHKAQFAWDMLTPLWQTIGRGIRGGCPVYIGFVDKKFAPMSFEYQNDGDPKDSGASSALVQAIIQLDAAINRTRVDVNSNKVAKLLYEPFFNALKGTEGLQYASGR